MSHLPLPINIKQNKRKHIQLKLWLRLSAAKLLQVIRGLSPPGPAEIFVKKISFPLLWHGGASLLTDVSEALNLRKIRRPKKFIFVFIAGPKFRPRALRQCAHKSDSPP